MRNDLTHEQLDYLCEARILELELEMLEEIAEELLGEAFAEGEMTIVADNASAAPRVAEETPW